jgi:hypothetical protein
VWDETNQISGVQFLHLSGVNQSTVRFYLSKASDGALLVNKGGTAACDEVINVDSGDVRELRPVAKAGTPWISTADGQAPSMAGCHNDPNGSDPSPFKAPPDNLCTDKASDMYQVIQHTTLRDDGMREPVVYADSPTATGFTCTGTDWEFASVFEPTFEGWVCIAARAVDNAGNVGVSRPLRVCVDNGDDADGTPDCANLASTPPTCTNGCTPPPRWGSVLVPWQ